MWLLERNAAFLWNDANVRSRILRIATIALSTSAKSIQNKRL
jgi:hypothetical protein